MSHRFSFLVFLSFASVVACGTDRTIVIEQPASSTSDTDPADGGSAESSKKPDGSLGPECTEYLSCCEDVATQLPSLATSCDSLKTSIQNAEDEGASTASYESTCKSGLSSFHSAGYCN